MRITLRIFFAIFPSLFISPRSVASASSSSSCLPAVPTPAKIPFRNVDLADANRIASTGLVISLGTPPRKLAFELQVRTNNSFVHDSQSPCPANATPQECEAVVGGFFDSNSSTTYKDAPSFKGLDTAIENSADLYNDYWGSDQLQINPELSFPDFPLPIKVTPGGTMNEIGIGLNSTLMTALLESGDISSKVWSYWPGSYTDDGLLQQDGGLVLGGYDAAKTKGANLTLPLSFDSGCISGLLLSVSDMILNLGNGNDRSLFASAKQEPFKACIIPAYGQMDIQRVIWNSFLDLSGTQNADPSGDLVYGSYGGPMEISTNESYSGDMTITLSSSLNITIPNQELIKRDYTIDKNGHFLNINPSQNQVLLHSISDNNNQPISRIGQVLLSSAYLSVDQERQQFTIWNIKRTDDERLSPIPPPGCPTPTILSAPSTSPFGVVTDNISNPGISSGAIAGIVVAVVVVIALTLLAYFLVRHRRRRQEEATRKALTYPSSKDLSELPQNPDMPSNGHSVHGTPLEKKQGYTTPLLPPHELAPTAHLQSHELGDEQRHELAGTQRHEL